MFIEYLAIQTLMFVSAVIGLFVAGLALTVGICVTAHWTLAG
jgi:hypothetical protein